MTMRTRTVVAAVIAAGAAAGLGGGAQAQEERPGVISISPARRSIVARPPVNLSPTQVANTTKTTFSMRIFPAELRQNLDGTFAPKEQPAELRGARLIFPIEPRSFVMRPGSTESLRLRWNLVPRGKKAVYMGLVVQGTPRGAAADRLRQILRLLGVNFFVTPGRHNVTGSLTRLTGEQEAPRVIRFRPRVRNRGEVHSEPRGRCVIEDAGGRVRFRESFGRDGVVIPGYEREFPIVLRETVLPAGSYVMTCRARFGRRTSRIRYPFRLSGPNTLPTAQLELEAVKAHGEIEGAAEVDVEYVNAGSKASPVVLKATLARGGRPGTATVPLARKTLRRDPLGPKGSGSASFELGKLTAGNYRVTVVLSDGRTDADTLSSDFTAEPKQTLWDWVKDNLLWLLLLLVLGVIGFLIWLVRRERRRREELEAAGAAVPAAGAAVPAASAPPPAAAPAAPAGGRVNLNTAGVEEIALLPGLSRRAAERVVEHREANGPFSSFDDLRAVPGFHAERIRRLQESAEV